MSTFDFQKAAVDDAVEQATKNLRTELKVMRRARANERSTVRSLETGIARRDGQIRTLEELNLLREARIAELERERDAYQRGKAEALEERNTAHARVSSLEGALREVLSTPGFVRGREKAQALLHDAGAEPHCPESHPPKPHCFCGHAPGEAPVSCCYCRKSAGSLGLA